MHRRKTSKEEQDDVPAISISHASPSSSRPIVSSNGNGAELKDDHGITFNGTGEEEDLRLFSFGSDSTKPGANGHGGWGNLSQSQRNRVASVPVVPSPLSDQFPTSQSHPPNPPSAGPYRTSFAVPRPPPNGLNTLRGSNGPTRHQPPALRQSLSLPSPHNSHSRTRSVSGPFSPSTPSPLGATFPIPQSTSYPPQGPSPVVLGSPPKFNGLSNGDATSSSPASTSHTRRHSRLHSRNLSVFFPRPGSLPVTTIDEDGTQEVNFDTSPSYSSAHSLDDGVLMPSASSPAAGQRTFRQGFTFGARPPGSAPLPEGATETSGTSKRGHHHKHSLSHNFFSFLEPGGGPEELHTQPTVTPASPWNPISPFPAQQSNSIHSQVNQIYPSESMKGHGLGVISREKSSIGIPRGSPEIDFIACVAAVVQFIVGACLWVVGQQIGSLSCTGLGYWVVFDSFGVCVGHILPGYLAKQGSQLNSQRSYGFVSMLYFVLKVVLKPIYRK
jgi:hypothetical protein